MINKNLLLELHVAEFSNATKDLLTRALQESFVSNNVDCSAQLLSHKKYWKASRKNQFLFLIQPNQALSIEQLASILDASFEINQHEAFWSKLNKQGELLHPAITQALIYQKSNVRKRKLCFLIRINISFLDPKIEKVVFENLSSTLAKSRPRLYVELLSSNQYWKYPESTEYVFDSRPSMEELIHFFNVPFKLYSNGTTAIWASHVQEGTLLHQNATWAHISRGQ